MSTLDLVLEKVRQSDLEQFRSKIEKMEKDKKGLNKAMGLMDFEDLLQETDKKVLVVEGEMAEEAEVKVSEPESTQSKEVPSGKDIFDNFIKTIRG